MTQIISRILEIANEKFLLSFRLIITMRAKRIGDLQTVENTSPHWAAAKNYNFIRVQISSGEEVPLLFTDAEILKARKRAEKNPEDLPKASRLRDIFD